MSVKKFVFRISIFILFWTVSHGIISVQEYCDKFNNYSVKPLICLLQVNTTSTQRPPDEWEWETEEDDGSCSCDVNCYPDDDPTFDLEIEPFLNISLPANLRCQPCGTSCSVNSFLTSRCNCVAIGPSTSSTGPKCQCTVTCAARNVQTGEDPYCIYNVTRITKLRGIWNPYSCDCEQSRAAQNSPFPEFTCVCQPN